MFRLRKTRIRMISNNETQPGRQWETCSSSKIPAAPLMKQRCARQGWKRSRLIIKHPSWPVAVTPAQQPKLFSLYSMFPALLVLSAPPPLVQRTVVSIHRPFPPWILVSARCGEAVNHSGPPPQSGYSLSFVFWCTVTDNTGISTKKYS